MLIYRCFIILFLFLSTQSFSQLNNEKDSLLTAYKIDPDNLETLSRLSQIYEFINTDSAILYAEELIKKAGKNNHFIGRAYQSLGNSYLTVNKLDESLENYQKAVNVAKKAGLRYDEAVYKQALAMAYLNLGESQNAVHHYTDALEYFISNPTAKRAEYFNAVIYQGLGDSYNQLGLYDLALENLFNSVEITERDQNNFSAAYAYNSIASVYQNLAEYDKSIEYNEKAKKQFEESGYTLGAATVNLNLATSYFEKKDIDKCIELLTLAETQLESINTTYNLGEVYSLFGKVYRYENDLAKSSLYFQKAFDIHNESGADQFIGGALLEIARNQYEEQEYKEAEFNAKQALEIFEKNNLPKERTDALLLILQNKLTGEERKDYLKRFIKSNNEFLSLEKQNSIIAQEIQFQTAEKENEIARQALEIQKGKNRKNILMGSIGILLILILTGYIWSRSRLREKDLELQNQLADLSLELSQMELTGLNSKLDPHEMKNLLASIAPEIQEKAPDSYKKMLKLLNLTKGSLGSKSLTESLKVQIRQVHDYMDLMILTTPEPMEFQVNNQLKDDVLNIPRLLLKNLTENAFKHGLKGKPAGGFIHIDIRESAERIFIVVDDNGKGRAKKEETINGVGITTYLNLFKTLNKINQEKAELLIKDKDQGTKVEIKVPKNYKYTIH